MTSDSIVTGIVIVILMCFFVMFIDYTIPIFAKMDFDNTCRTYSTLVAAEGSLTEEEYHQFVEALEQRGFDDVEVDISDVSDMMFRSQIHFEVKAIYHAYRTEMLFKRIETEIPCQHSSVLYLRKYIN